MKPFNLSQHLTRSSLNAADYLTMDATDSSVGFQALVDAVNATPWGADVYLPAGAIRLATVQYTFTKPVTLRGAGVVQSEIHLYGHARLIFDYNRTTVFEAARLNQSLKICDLSILTDGIHNTSPIRIDYSPVVDGALNNTVEVENVTIAGRTPTSGFTTGIVLVDVGFAKFRNVSLVGDYGNVAAYASGTGIQAQGTGGSMSFDQVRGYFMTNFVYVSGEYEGLVFNDCEVVACHNGITCLDTTNGFQPLVNILSTHLNCESTCVKFVGITQFHIGTGCLFYGQGTKGIATEWIGIDITPSTLTGADNTVICSGRIADVTLIGDGAFAATKTGIRIRGNAPMIERYLLSGNHLQGLSTGIQLDAQVNQVSITSSNTFMNCVTNIVNNGGGNYREPRVVALSLVGTTNASGYIVIDWGLQFQVFPVAPSIVVCGGDGGADTYTVLNSSVTGSGFTVVCANNGVALPAGQARRINFIATGYV